MNQETKRLYDVMRKKKKEVFASILLIGKSRQMQETERKRQLTELHGHRDCLDQLVKEMGIRL